MSIKNRVIKTIEEHEMLNAGDKVLVAVSGGADSVCLLHVLNTLKSEFNIKIYAAHLNHMIRGEEADKDQVFVENLCKKLGVECFVRKTEVISLAKEEGMTIEEAGRKARYDFFEDIRKSKKIDKIATAHNKNDRAETVIMRIIRGTGLDGLRGISYKREDGVIRPVLDITRDDIEAYCTDNGLGFCTDSTNSDNNYTRNRIRNQVLPYLKENFNSSIIETLVRFSDVASNDADFLNAYAQRLYERLNNPMPSNKPNALHIDSLNMLDYSVKVRLIKIAAKKAVGDEIKLEHKNILDILSLTEKETGAGIDLPSGLRVEINYGWLVFVNKNEKKEPVTVSKDSLYIEVKPLNTYFLENINRNITLKLVNPGIYKKNEREILVDYDKLEGKKLIIRNRFNGDKMVCFSDGRTKKLKSIFIDSKIEKSDRDKIPLLCTEDEIIAIIGNRVSEKYKITKNTERALAVEYGKDKSIN